MTDKRSRPEAVDNDWEYETSIESKVEVMETSVLSSANRYPLPYVLVVAKLPGGSDTKQFPMVGEWFDIKGGYLSKVYRLKSRSGLRYAAVYENCDGKDAYVQTDARSQNFTFREYRESGNIYQGIAETLWNADDPEWTDPLEDILLYDRSPEGRKRRVVSKDQVAKSLGLSDEQDLCEVIDQGDEVVIRYNGDRDD